MVCLKTLRNRGIYDEKLKERFTKLPYPLGLSGTSSAPLERLAFRVRSRVQDGQQNNFKHFKLYHAIDQAFDVPFQQISPTLARALASGEYDDSVLNAAKEWGLSHLIQDTKDEKTGKPVKKVVVPAFFNIFVPLVRAYTLIRSAKLTNDRNLFPYFKFEPIRSTPQNRARCEIITDRIDAMVTQMGYRDMGRQAIFKMLLYGVQLMFIQEEWWEDEQEVDPEFEGEYSAEKVKAETKLIREGLRYHLPHPTRTYWDTAHPLSTINSDNGCEWAGYWRVRRFSDIRQNMHLWNTDKIAFNSKDLRSDNALFFNTVYSACTLSFPQSTTKYKEMDRETDLQNQFYTSDWDDSAIVIGEHFEKVNPKRDGLGDYDHPVWFRFVTGGDGTILYAAPLPDHPCIYFGYDPDESRSINASLALEILPFQDQISNLLTQALLSVRQNLANLTFVDQDIVDSETLKGIENLGEAQFRKLNFVRFSGRKTRAAQQDVRYAFGSVRFPQLDVPSILNAINAVLAVLERVLVMSAQEIAGQATHEQSREEILHVRASTSTRLSYTSMQVDRAWDSWKRQLYAYLMAFGAAEIYGQLSQDPAYTPELLTLLGFSFETEAKAYDEKHQVKGPKKSLQLEYFASTRDGNDRVNDTTLAQAMLQMLTAALQNPMISQQIGPEQSIMLINQVLEQMGLPRDFKLRAMPGAPPEQQQQMMQQQLMELAKQMKQFVQQGDQTITQEFKSEMKPLADAIKQAMQIGKDNQSQIAQIIQTLAKQPQTSTSSSQARPRLTIGGPA